MIKAIETRYKGYRFRSRLEARWAVFFDAMGWVWEYESEGFDLGNGVYYLPDFKMYGNDSNGDYNVFYFEIKPADKAISETEKRKILAFGKSCREENLLAGYGDFILLDGPPEEKLYISAGHVLDPDNWPYEPFWWGMDIVYRDGRPTFDTLGDYRGEDRFEEYIYMKKCFGNVGYIGDSPIAKARAARFEHGERG